MMQTGGGGFECASSILLCREDNSSILDFDDGEGGSGMMPGDHLPVGSDENHERSDLYGESFAGFSLQPDEWLDLLVSRESDHMPKEDYASSLRDGSLLLSVRREAIDWIGKVHVYYNFGPLSAYLSVNYLDRFLSYYEIPEGKAWMTQLLSVACLSLSAKMEETQVPLSLDLQVCEPKYVFEAKTIQRMELLVLNTLQWRMQAVTPFSFIYNFLDHIKDGKSSSIKLLSQSMDLILSAIRRIDILEFRPSEIAAAVILYVSRTLAMNHSKFFSSYVYLSKERVLRCHEVIKEMALVCPNGSTSSVPQSPIGVLDAACVSSKSDSTTAGSEAMSHNSSPDAKRRKISR